MLSPSGAAIPSQGEVTQVLKVTNTSKVRVIQIDFHLI